MLRTSVPCAERQIWDGWLLRWLFSKPGSKPCVAPTDEEGANYDQADSLRSSSVTNNLFGRLGITRSAWIAVKEPL